MRAVAVKIVGEFIGHIRSAVSLGKGGTEELHSRTGNGAPGRPCQLAALSGRRAAQDGCDRALGGPERAGMEGLGEVLSAGRAAAPDQFPRELLGRGRSADRVAHVLAERAKPGGSCGHGEAARASARARPFQAMARAVVVAVAVAFLFVAPAKAANPIAVGANAEGTIEFPLENNSDSGDVATDVQIAPRVEPSGMADRIQFTSIKVKEDASATFPISIAKGQTRTVVVSYTITSAAQDGDSFQVFLDADLPGQVIDPDPATWDTSVLLVSFSV